MRAEVECNRRRRNRFLPKRRRHLTAGMIDLHPELRAICTTGIGPSAEAIEIPIVFQHDTGRPRHRACIDHHIAGDNQARATLTDNRSKQAYFVQRTLTAKRGAFTDSGLVPAEYQTLPLLAEQLAGETLHAVLDVW